MAPEQLEGKPRRRATDVFALGSVLYEMVTGRKAFSGASQASLISAILTTEPPPPLRLAADEPAGARPPREDVPRQGTRGSLAVRSRRRAAASRDPGGPLVVLGLRDCRSGSCSIAPRLRRAAVGDRHAGRTRRRRGGLLETAGAGLRGRARFASPSRPRRVDSFGGWGEGVSLQLSPDGRRLAFAAYEDNGPVGIWVRDLSSQEARLVDGTAGANSFFWSPDGESIAFFTPRHLARVPVTGGSAVTICDLGGGIGRSGTWGSGGQILFRRPGRRDLQRPRGRRNASRPSSARIQPTATSASSGPGSSRTARAFCTSHGRPAARTR